jgi:septin family protein
LCQLIKPGRQALSKSTFINTLINKKGLSIEDTKAFIVGVVGDSYQSVSRLTSAQASALIKALQA